MTSVIYTGTADVRIVAPSDIGDAIKEEIHFRPGEPVELTKKAWKAIQDNASLSPVFAEEGDPELEEDNNDPIEPDGLPNLDQPT